MKEKMKLTKSKQFLADAIHASGKGWPCGNFAAQQDDGEIWFSNSKPKWSKGRGTFYMGYEDHITIGALVANRHQTILSREEYFSAYPAEPVADADGWIEWKGGKCPVDGGYLVDYKMRDGDVCEDGEDSLDLEWEHLLGGSDIIAYRLHKPEVKPEFCESVARSIPEPAIVGVDMASGSDSTAFFTVNAKPTIEQLAADCRNAKDYAERKQQEADAAKADAEAKLSELVEAGKAHGLVVSPITVKQEPGPVITDWRDLQVGDEIEVFDFDDPDDGSKRKAELMSGVCVVMRTGACVHIELKSNLPKTGSYWNANGVDKCKFRFIRRP